MKWGVIFFILLLANPATAVTLRTTVTLDDYKALTEAALGVAEIQQLLGADSRIILFKVGSESAHMRVQGTSLLESSQSSLGNPDFTIELSRDSFLSIVNSGDKVGSIKLLLANGAIAITAADPAKQAALKAALSSGLVKAEPFGVSSKVVINGQETTVQQFGSIFRAKVGNEDYVLNKFGSPIGALSRKHDLFANPPADTGVFFKKPPGVLAQNPGLIYDTVTKSNYGVGPHNIFKVNPGLIGPNDILRLNPGLMGPADIGLLNPNLAGPKEFAYLLGIGAHSNTAKELKAKGLVTDRTLDITNRWGNRR